MDAGTMGIDGVRQGEKERGKGMGFDQPKKKGAGV